MFKQNTNNNYNYRTNNDLIIGKVIANLKLNF